jgi:hypothetical protein
VQDLFGGVSPAGSGKSASTLYIFPLNFIFNLQSDQLKNNKHSWKAEGFLRLFLFCKIVYSRRRVFFPFIFIQNRLVPKRIYVVVHLVTLRYCEVLTPTQKSRLCQLRWLCQTWRNRELSVVSDLTQP